MSELRNELDALSGEAERFIKAKRRRAAAVIGVKRFLPLVIVVPALWLMLSVVLHLGTGGVSGGWPWWIVILTVLLPAGCIFLVVAMAAMQPVDRRDALAALDQELGLEDRLVTAEEFLRSDLESPFVAAALSDAARVAPQARAAVLKLERDRFELGQREWRFLAASAILLLIGSWVGGRDAAVNDMDGTAGSLDSDVVVLDVRDEDSLTRPEPETRDERVEPEPSEAVPAKSKSAATRRDKAGKLSDQTKESEGKTGEGRSSDAESTSGASESRGMPSNQSQQSKAGEKPNKKDAKKKPKPPTDLKPTEKKTAEENSGSTAGKGSSKGSNKNPAVSKWSSKDQVTTQDDQEIEDDEDTEDEEEDQESRGGMQPNLRDRKPPVSRDLRIGFGNQKNPDANGRGGPSEAKKSRGTASLVLGVPIPDRVKGQPNPGKTKITQERIEPKAEESAAIEASARKSRQTPAGNVQERELTPWMRTLIREYFLTLRNKNRRS